MTTFAIRLMLAALLTLTTVPAYADHEGPDGHAHGATKTIIVDGKDILPSTTTMSHGDLVSFLNYSTNPVRLTFTDAGLEKRIRCGLVHAKGKNPSAPWALFTWEDGKLVGNVPPGQFASVCSFEPGSYAFTAKVIGHQTPGGEDTARGQLEVK
jgi:hypothetical protein